MPLIKNYSTLNALRYGNLDLVQEKYLTQSNIFTSKKSYFINKHYPKLSDTYKEVDSLIEINKSVLSSRNFDKNFRFISQCDKDIHSVFNREFSKIGIKYNGDLLELIQEQLGVLIMQLKSKFNRPRPYQFAYYSEQKLFPFPTISGHSPSYPSGHACQSHFLMEVVAHKNPSQAGALRRLGQKISDTRIAMGVHYQSDNDFGTHISRELIKMKDIQKKFFKT